jgi:hypothetical protein
MANGNDDLPEPANPEHSRLHSWSISAMVLLLLAGAAVYWITPYASS